MPKLSQPHIHQRIRAAMTLQRTAALTAVICVALTLLGASFTPTEHQLSAAVLGLILTVTTTLAFRHPLLVSVIFVAVWMGSTFAVGTPYLCYIFLTPILIAVIAYHGKNWQTFGIGAVF